MNAKKARDEGWFDQEIEPVAVQLDGAEEPVKLKHDTHIMDDVSLQKMARLRPAFEPGGVITAGNASAVVDGAAAMVIGKESDAAKHKVEPLARIRTFATASCDPQIMGWGPVPAVEKALSQAGLKGDQIDHVELNEAFAPQAIACIRDFAEMGIDPEKVNPQGSAIALGHPLGATGAMIFGTVLDELERSGKETALTTLCVGGGMGTATIIERV